MANFYSEIKEKFTDCDISYVEPLSYIKLFAPADYIDAPLKKIILFYKRGLPSEKVQIKPVRDEFKFDISNRLDLTGSPLKDSCTFEMLDESVHEELETKNAWNDDDERYQCIAEAHVQTYFNKIAYDYRKESVPKIWAICDESSDNKLLLSLEKPGSKWRRGIHKFNGITKFEPVNLVGLQAKHLKYVVKQFGPSEAMIDSYYKMGSDAVLQVSHSVNGAISQSNIADGKTPGKMSFHQSVKINNHQSTAHLFWRQLGILNEIKDTILAFKSTQDPNYLVFKGYSDGDVTEMKKEIQEMLTQPLAIGLANEDDENNRNPDTNIDKIVDAARIRISNELTDQLWDVLKGCSSYDVLKQVLEYIFTTAAKINVVNMPSGDSRLANLIRDVCDHRIAIPRLTGSEPLELLLEIGLEKVNKDYEYIFTESRLCTAEALRVDKKVELANGGPNVRKSLKNQFITNGSGSTQRKTLMHTASTEDESPNDSKENIGFQNSRFDSKKVANNLARLGRIHLILEHLLKIKSNLNLENVYTTFSDDLNKPLVSFDDLKENSMDFQTIPVTNTKILTKIGEIPHKQRVFMKARNKFKIYRNTFYFSTEPIFPPHVFKSIENNNIESESVYYAHQYLEIEDA